MKLRQKRQRTCFREFETWLLTTCRTVHKLTRANIFCTSHFLDQHLVYKLTNFVLKKAKQFPIEVLPEESTMRVPSNRLMATAWFSDLQMSKSGSYLGFSTALVPLVPLVPALVPQVEAPWSQMRRCRHTCADSVPTRRLSPKSAQSPTSSDHGSASQFSWPHWTISGGGGN